VQFEFEGSTYRIGFTYDRNRDWAAHWGHKVELWEKNSSGPTFLQCRTCDLQLSHVPKAQRKRLVHCAIWTRRQEGWESVVSGIGRVNLKAGDRFSRREGREAALRDCLDNYTKRSAEAGGDWDKAKAFRAAAWFAYTHRKLGVNTNAG
jgi:hypothetical protein